MTEQQPPGPSVDGGTFAWFLGATGLAAVALVVAIIAIFTPPGGNGTSVSTPAGKGGAKTIEVELGEMYIKPASIDIAPGTVLTAVVTNKGTMPHDFRLEGKKGTKLLKPGETQTVELGAIDATTQAWCTVPGHKEAGMLMDINVAGSSGAAASGTAAGAAGDFAKIDPNKKPAADWKPRDPVLPPADTSTTVHNITFNMTEKKMEVAPGVTQTLWTFEDQVPGPILHGKLGDTFNVTIVNKAKMGHSIDFHASQVAWNDEMRTIQPGESLLYSFKAEYAGIFMYHCGTDPTLHHIGNGMYGALVIDPPDLAPVDKEFVFLQSEFYLGPEGGVGDLTKMQNNDFDAVVFNGYFAQYKFAPIQINTGKPVRVWVLDDGPNENSSFHVVGTIYHTVYKEGAYLLQPDAGHGGSQALDLQPAQGGFVEFTTAEDGFYVAVTHKFSNVGKGAVGLFRSGEAELPAAGGH